MHETRGFDGRGQAFRPQGFSRRLQGAGIFRALLAVLLLSAGAFFYFFGLGGPELKMVSGTEYISGEYGQVIVRLADKTGSPIAASCLASMLFPDKSYFLLDRPMSASAISGNYFLEFATPSVVGIYEERISCNAEHNGKSIELRVSSSFHVSPGLNAIRDMAANQSRMYVELSDRLARIEYRLDELNKEVNASNNGINSTLQGLNTGLSGLNGTITGLAVSVQASNAKALDKLDYISSSIDGVNRTVGSKFSGFYEDMRAVSNAMSNVFSGRN